MKKTRPWSTSPVGRDCEVLEVLQQLVAGALQPPRWEDAISHIARRMRRSLDRTEQALRRLHPSRVIIGRWHGPQLIVTPADRTWGAIITPVHFDERVTPWVDLIEKTLREEVARRGRAIVGAELRRAMIAAGHPVTSQSVCHGLVWLRKHDRAVRIEVPASDPTRRRVRFAWTSPEIPVSVQHVMPTHADILFASVDEMTTILERPVSRGEIKAWVAAEIPGASPALCANYDTLQHISARLLPVMLNQHERLIAYRPLGAARGSLGPRYARDRLSPVQSAAIGVEDAIERFRFGADVQAERQLRDSVDADQPVMAAFLAKRAAYRRIALHLSVASDAPIRDGLALARRAAEAVTTWLPTRKLQRRAGGAYRRAQRVLEDASLVEAALDTPLPPKNDWKVAGETALRDWPKLELWQDELLDIAPRMRSASSIVAEARRFPIEHRQSIVETAETALDAIDALRLLLATSPLAGAKALMDGVSMLLGTVLRDPDEVAPLLTSRHDGIPAYIRRSALVAIGLLGGEVEIDPVQFGHDQLDLDALAMAAALDPDATAETIAAVLEPITALPLPTRGRAEQLIARAKAGLRLTLTNFW